MDIPTLLKQPSESRVYAMEFAANMALGETITAVVDVSVDKVGLTLSGAATFSGTKAFQRIEGGEDGDIYKVTITVTTSAGNTLQGDGFLRVRDL